MPRQARQMSCSGFLHVVVRGIGRQILFEENADYLYYISILKKKSREASILVCAYCLMENHVHILLFDPHKNTPDFMKKIGISYATYFNIKYQRTGHLFQDRYKSEPVESERYLLTVFRYILRNPQKAGICTADEYKWSSYKDYDSANTFVNTSFLVNLIGDFEQYEKFIMEDNKDSCLEYSPKRKTDDEAKEILYKYLLTSDGTKLQLKSKQVRDNIIKKLLEEGLSIRQVERLTGISRGVVQRIKRLQKKM